MDYSASQRNGLSVENAAPPRRISHVSQHNRLLHRLRCVHRASIWRPWRANDSSLPRVWYHDQLASASSLVCGCRPKSRFCRSKPVSFTQPMRPCSPQSAAKLLRVFVNRILISRWMWNVEAVKQWVDNPNRPQHPNWWPPTRDEVAQNQGTAQQTGFENYISDFVGQGRQIGYNGLPYAVAISVYNSSETNRTMRSLQTITDELIRCLNGRRPGSWWALAVTSLLLVWLEIGMAFMISFNIPTVGIGCRSLSYLIYGGLSSFPWMIHLLPSFGGSIVKNGLRWLSTLFTLLSTGVLCFIIFAAVSGPLLHLSPYDSQ